jgi:transcriptional regulator with XRE-family HTH domain
MSKKAKKITLPYIKRLRIRKKLTQHEFCKKVGIEQSKLSKLENGKSLLTMNIACRIYQNLKVSPKELMDAYNTECGKELKL